MSAKLKEKERKEREKRELADANEPLEKVDAMRRQLADLAPIAEEPNYVSSYDTCASPLLMPHAPNHPHHSSHTPTFWTLEMG